MVSYNPKLLGQMCTSVNGHGLTKTYRKGSIILLLFDERVGIDKGHNVVWVKIVMPLDLGAHSCSGACMKVEGTDHNALWNVVVREC